MKLFITSDQHYNHTKILEYGLDRRGNFKDTNDMNNVIIQRHNELVSDNDIVLNLGDFSFGGKKYIEEIITKLNGNQYLLLGNHDRKRTVTFFKRMGFIKVYKYPIFLRNIVLSHEPIYPQHLLDMNKFNFHGHIHNLYHYNEFLKETGIDRYANFVVESTNFYPFEIRKSCFKQEILNYLFETI
jgi:calcineurin-like phosphoesterase family protein